MKSEKELLSGPFSDIENLYYDKLMFEVGKGIMGQPTSFRTVLWDLMTMCANYGAIRHPNWEQQNSKLYKEVRTILEKEKNKKK